MFKGLADNPCFITQVALEVMLLLTITTLASFLQSNLPQVKKSGVYYNTSPLFILATIVKLAQSDCRYLCFRCRI